jgi:hypothetical protein
MSRHTTEDLVHELARDLPPVKSIARLRVVAAKVLVLWLCALGVSWLLGEHRLSVVADSSGGDWIRWSVWVGLAVLAGGAVLAALASAVPGRERAAEAGRAVAVLGVAWVIGSGLWAVAGAEGARVGTPLAGSFACFRHAIALGLPSLWIAAAFLSRGTAVSPRTASAVAAAGAASLGAFAVHAVCPISGGYHVMLGHCLTPIFAAGLFALPLAALIARASRASSHSLDPI